MKNDLAKWASAPPSWATGHDTGPTVSTRVRVARNLSGLPFPHNASPAAQRTVVERVFEAAPQSPGLSHAQNLALVRLTPLERDFLMERQLISHEHARADGDRGLVVAPGESLSIMINEEDHLRLAAFQGGLAFEDAWAAVSALDEALNAKIPLAFDSEFGFATACPTNMGSGLRASCLMHLPACVMTNRIGTILEGLSRSGLTARGFYGEGTSASGDLFQVSNAQTLGRTEVHLIREVERAVRQVAALELKEGAALMAGESRRAVEDRVHRALGTMLHARLLEHAEAMKLLSLLRFGLRMGLELGVRSDAVNDLVYLTQPAHVRLRAPKGAAGLPEAALRADLVRERLLGKKG